MKNKIILAILFTPLFIGCSNDSDEAQTIPQESTPLLITASQNKATSRVAFENDGVVVNWISGDKFTVFGASEKRVFTLVDGADTPKGIFKGDPFTGGGPYQAFYPEAKAKDTYDACILDATGQSQATNGDMDHLANYTYMTGNVTLGAEGEARVGFSHQMVMMKFVLTLPENVKTDETLQAFMLETDQANAFVLKKGVSGTGEVKGSVMSMDLTGITVEADNKVTLYMMMNPFSLNEGSKLRFTIETKVTAGDDPRGTEDIYQARFYDLDSNPIGDGGKSYEAGMKYTYTAAESLKPVIFTRSDDTVVYPMKVTNLTTGKFYLIAAPNDDTTYLPAGVTSYTIEDANWTFISTTNNRELINSPTIEEITGLSLTYTAVALDTTILPGFEDIFISSDKKTSWLSSNGTNRYYFALSGESGNTKIAIGYSTDDITFRYGMLRFIRKN